MIRLYDTMAREKREFMPQDPDRITMYVCGPTVYNRATSAISGLPSCSMCWLG